MKEAQETGEHEKQRAFLIGVRDGKISKGEAASLADELAELADTLELEVVDQEIVHVREHNAKYGMGSGKAEELAQKAKDLEVDCMVFDQNLSPSQQRNWEEISGVSVIDRQELIIQIFASRARTREAELQVSLAELKYSLPRLQHKYIDLSRQRGGRYGTKGSGETRLETDRRIIEQRIHRLEEDLEEVKLQREVQRKQRERQGVPICALVGYTNSGKSSLLNALTGSDVFAEDKLFATLDPTFRRMELPGGMQVLLVDTVGFIRRLPHNLVNAFRSTLEEASRAALLVNVLDAADENASEHQKTTLSVLGEIGAGDIPILTVLNKIDRVEDDEARDALAQRFPKSIPISALTKANLDTLCARIEQALSKGKTRFRFPASRTDLAALLHRSGQVFSETYTDDHIDMEAQVDETTSGRLREYKVD